MKKLSVVFASLVLLLCPLLAEAQNPTPIIANSSVSLSLTVQSSASMTCTPLSVTFTYSGGTGTASGPITCTFSWNVPQVGGTGGFTFIDFAAYLAGGAAAALSSGSNNIPASSIFSSNDSNGPIPCTQTLTSNVLGNSNAACYVLIPGSPNVSSTSGNMTHTFLLSISQPNVNAGNYSGSLTVVADIQ